MPAKNVDSWASRLDEGCDNLPSNGQCWKTGHRCSVSGPRLVAQRLARRRHLARDFSKQEASDGSRLERIDARPGAKQDFERSEGHKVEADLRHDLPAL